MCIRHLPGGGAAREVGFHLVRCRDPGRNHACNSEFVPHGDESELVLTHEPSRSHEAQAYEAGGARSQTNLRLTCLSRGRRWRELRLVVAKLPGRYGGAKKPGFRSLHGRGSRPFQNRLFSQFYTGD